MAAPPRTMIYVARAQLAVVAVIAVVGLVGGIGMQLELWAPGGAWSAAHYTRMLDLHGLLPLAVGTAVLAGSFGYLLIAELTDAQRVPAPALAWVSFGLWVVGLAAVALVMFAQGSPETGWSTYTPYSVDAGPAAIWQTLRSVSTLAFAAAGLGFATHQTIVILAARRTAGGLQLGAAAAFVLAIAAAACGLVLATAGAALVLAVAAVVGAPRDAQRWPVRVFVVLGAAPGLVLYELTHWFTRALATDIHLHDTYFIVGGYHALAALLAFTCLAALHAWGSALLGRAPQAALALVGALAMCAGMLLHVVAELRVGAAGMPRRYWDYDPQFTSSHQLAGIGAAIIVAGLALLAVAWLVGRNATASRTASPG